jgi:hypothetical protein
MQTRSVQTDRNAFDRSRSPASQINNRPSKQHPSHFETRLVHSSRTIGRYLSNFAIPSCPRSSRKGFSNSILNGQNEPSAWKMWGMYGNGLMETAFEQRSP